MQSFLNQTNARGWLFVIYMVIFVCLPTKALSQIVQLSNLFNFHNIDRNEIDDFLMNKGCSLGPTQSLSPYYKVFSYAPKSSIIHRSISLGYYKGVQLVEVGYTTGSQQEYISLKSQIKSKGYQFASSDVTDIGSTLYTYRNNKKLGFIILISQSYSQESGHTLYDITVQNERLYLHILDEAQKLK